MTKTILYDYELHVRAKNEHVTELLFKWTDNWGDTWKWTYNINWLGVYITSSSGKTQIEEILDYAFQRLAFYMDENTIQ